MPGRLVHFEIRAGEKERARQFWGTLFGWKFNDWEGTVPYSLIESDGQSIGGLYQSDSPERGLITYFDVDDLEAALVRVQELGGEVLEGKSPVPEVGWFARCRDTEGNEFSLFESDAAAPGG